MFLMFGLGRAVDRLERIITKVYGGGRTQNPERVRGSWA